MFETTFPFCLLRKNEPNEFLLGSHDYMKVSATLIILATYSITDGDTLRSEELRLRLWGIDAPEPNKPGGQVAKEALANITRGLQLTCNQVDLDRYGRVVAQCLLPDGVDIACELVKAGHARDWPRYSRGFYSDC
ncbi:thermonuclease family protein [Shimia thalassica]|uniref:thermonuclease family protein n=1 Tax=Shimia thalassica TaxID=1715693 RepID=UPI001C088716|nr:thermonuclease family protein [Shimia thalassica]MBU2941436.1 thermonuclease family protein [Shimia thalassica]MDO6504183.1 thermonuclease family protein [Shimia thalassica]